MAEKKKAPAGSNFWQIYFPTLVGVLIILFLGVWMVLETSPGNISRFAEISTVLLVIPVLVGSLFFALLLGGVIYLVVRIMGGIPSITAKILEVLEKVRNVAARGSKSAVVPVIRPVSFLAGFRRLFSRDKTRV